MEAMPEVITTLKSFPQYVKLPAELRVLVWKHSLPNIEPTLYPYQAGLWNHRTIPDSDERWDVDGSNFNLDGYFRQRELQNGAGYEVPGILVNRESNMAVQAWLRNPRCRLWRDRDRNNEASDDARNWTFQRVFNPDFDVIYIAPGMWYTFLEEEQREQRRRQWSLFEPEPTGFHYPIAIDINTFLERMEGVSKLVEGQYFDIHELNVIAMGDIGTLNPSSTNLSGRSELKPMPGGHFCYHNELSRYKWKHDGSNADTSLARYVGGKILPLNQTLADRFGFVHPEKPQSHNIPANEFSYHKSGSGPGSVGSADSTFGDSSGNAEFESGLCCTGGWPGRWHIRLVASVVT